MHTAAPPIDRARINLYDGVIGKVRLKDGPRMLVLVLHGCGLPLVPVGWNEYTSIGDEEVEGARRRDVTDAIAFVQVRAL